MRNVHVAVLGDLVVTDAGAELSIQGPIPRRLVALLASRAGEFRLADTLADQVWAGSPPPAARATLQSHIARLRRAVGADRIESSHAGYRLAIERTAVDAYRFVGLAEAGRRALGSSDTETARATLTEALELWRGPAYAEFSGYPALDGEAARLHQLRVDARQWLLEAEVAGPGLPPVAAVEAMVREHPTREGLWVLLMKALYRAGRQSDALAAYRNARRFLIEELGVEPSRELRETEQMILVHDASLDPPAGPAGAIAPVVAPDAGAEVRERRTVTVAVLELPVSDGADPEDVAARGRAFRDLVRECIAAFGGTVYAELEGLVIAAFGLRRARTDDAARALRAAVTVLERSNADPAPRAAIGTGETVVTATSGHAELSGPLLAATDQLRAHAHPGVVLIDGATKPFVEEIATLAREAQGWRVGSLTIGHSTIRATTPFIGREHDLALLRGALSKALDGRRPQLVSVEGEAGLGKTRLLREFESRLATDAVAVAFWRSHCPPNADAPIAPIADIVRAAASIGDTTALDAASAAVRALLPTDEADQLLPAILVALGADTTSPRNLGGSLVAWRRLVELAASRPTVLIVEDLHWASDVALDFVESLPTIAGPCPLVVVTTTRPELRERRPSWAAGNTTVTLSALGAEQTEMLIEHLTSDAAISDAERDMLIARSGGIPLFAEELARLARHESTEADITAVPPALSAVIAARIDTVDTRHRGALSVAALVGPGLWSDQVAAVLETDETVAVELLEDLAQRAFLDRVRPSGRPGHHEFLLSHELIREAAERRLPREERAQHHLAAFRWWIENMPDAGDAHAALLAHHACTAYDLAVAAGLDELAARTKSAAGAAALTAGQRLQGIDTSAALRFLRRATELIDAASPDHARALMWLGAALSDDRDFVGAEGLLIDALDRLERVNDPLRVEASMFLLMCRFALGHDLARVDAAISRARDELPPSIAAVRNLGGLGVLRLMEQTTEALRTAIAVSDEAIALAATLGTGGDALARVVRGRARLSLGDPDGLVELESALDEVARMESGTIAIGTRQWHAGAMHHWRGPVAERDSRAALEELAVTRGLGSILSMSAAEDMRVAYEMGELRRAIAMAEKMPTEHEAQPRWAAVQRGLALLDLGELDPAGLARVTATPPADEGDLRHILGVVLAVAGTAALDGDLGSAAAALARLGDLQRYVERDGAVELVPRLVRTALACGRGDLVNDLTGIDAVPTPLRQAIAATVTGLVAEAAGDADRAARELRRACDRWHELGFKVEEAHTLADLARNLTATRDPAADATTTQAEAAAAALGIRGLLTPRGGG